MNKENLLKMAEYIATVPQEKFDMTDFRTNYGMGRISPKCNSVGCVIGHCTILDTEPLPIEDGVIQFFKWSEHFTELDSDSSEWEWCFDAGWSLSDNTPKGASVRIKYLIENGLPKNWREQMDGTSPLCYEVSR